MDRSRWTFLTSHAFVLLHVTQRPDATVRELADLVGLTERHVHRVLGDLEEAGFLDRERIGRRNHYRTDRARELPGAAAIEVRDLLETLNRDGPGRNRTYARSFEGSRSVL
jgi:DNA-binding IclR family transcriptional regulator